MSATELTPAMLREMGCLSARVQYALDEAGSGALEFLEEPALSHGQELSILGKTWWVQNITIAKQGEKARWSVELEDEDARLNKTPYLGKPDWSDKLPKGTKTAQVSRLMDALGLEWNEEDALVPVPSLSGGESIGDIKKQILQWVQRNCPPAGNAAVGSLLRYAPNSTAHATGEVRMNFNTLPVGGLRSGLFVGNREVRVSAPANAAALASSINADTDFPAAATASGTRINLTAKTAGDAGNDIRLGVGEEEGDVTRSGDNLTGGADGYVIEPAKNAEIFLAVGVATDWVDMGTPTSVWLEIGADALGYAVFDYDTMGQATTASEYVSLFNARCTAQEYPFAAELVDELTIRIFYTVAGATGNTITAKLTNIRYPGQLFGLGHSPDDIAFTADENIMNMQGGADEQTQPATRAIGWIDLGTTGTHPLVQHTGLFVNGTEVMGHSLSPLDVVNALNASTDYGVTAALTSGSVADSIVYLTARAAGAEGNAVSLDYTGDDGVTLSGSTLAGGTLGAVETIGRLFGGEDSKATALRINPRYDLLCPAAGVYGRFNIVYPAGASLAQPGAFAYYVAPLELVGDRNGSRFSSGAFPSSWLPAVRDAAGQVMEVRGRRVPAGWSISDGSAPSSGLSHDFWTKLPQFRLLEKLGLGKIAYGGSMTFYPVSVEKAYPEESEGEDTLPPPANYKAITSGNLYLLVQGTFPGSSKSSNNPSGLNFCQGTLRQSVYFIGDLDELPAGVKKEDVEKFFSDTETRETPGGKKYPRSITLVVSGIFIDRRVKRFYTGSNADVQPDGGGGGGGGGPTPEEESREEELSRRDYDEALRQYYEEHSILYNDVTVESVKVPANYDPQSILGAQLVAEAAQTAACPVRRVTLDLLTMHMSVESGSPEMFSFNEFLQQRQLIRKGALRAISQATSGTTENG